MSEEYTPPMEVAAGILAGKYSLPSVYVLTTQIAHLTCERDEARAEVERLRRETERLRAENEKLHREDTLTRHALKRWVFVDPDGGDAATHERVAAVVSEVERLRGDVSGPDPFAACSALMNDQGERARKALEGAP